jgi:hypothetical protein
LSIFKGYFFGSVPLEVNVNEYQWFSFNDMRGTFRRFALFLSCLAFFMVTAYFLRDLYKKGIIQDLIDRLGKN